MYNLDNPILLLRRHLVIARQTEPAPENIGSNVDSRAFYVSICAASAVALNRNKRIRPIYRLHMHGLPDGAAFGIEGGESLENLGGAGFARGGSEEC